MHFIYTSISFSTVISLMRHEMNLGMNLVQQREAYWYNLAPAQIRNRNCKTAKEQFAPTQIFHRPLGMGVWISRRTREKEGMLRIRIIEYLAGAIVIVRGY